MNARRRRIAPMIGGVTAAAAVAGAIAPATQVAVAAPDTQSGAQSPLGLAQEGTFESCSAYFGHGKGVVGFDVADVNGDDGVAHAVPDDVDVVLVLENEAGDTIECIPEEMTQQVWDDDWGWALAEPLTVPSSPTRYRYPVVSEEYDIEQDDFGVVTAAGFRVVGLPDEHTLVSPTGVQPLADPFPTWDEVNDGIADPRVLALITEGAGPEAATAFSTALADCEDYGDIDQPLTDALGVLNELLGWDDSNGPETCDVERFEADSELAVSLLESVGYLEPIRLQVPEQETTTTTTAAPTGEAPAGQAPAAQAAQATPTYTG